MVALVSPLIGAVKMSQSIPGPASDSVLGHYLEKGGTLQPLLPDSSEIFKAVVIDNISSFESQCSGAELDCNRFYSVLFWTSDPKPSAVQVKQRTLLMLAAYHGSLRVLSYLLSKGANPSLKSPDNVTAASLAKEANTPISATVLAMLQDSEGNFPAAYPRSGGSMVDPVIAPPTQAGSRTSAYSDVSSPDRSSTTAAYPLNMDMQHLGMHQPDVHGDLFNPEGFPYSTSELTRPEYSTDTFRMFCFKVLRCSKRYAHDWRACPFAHPTENARRRDPREMRYCSIACPDYKQGFCIRGDACPFSHGVFECWLHPSRYRTQLCKDGANCHRPVCFFAHSLSELRTPTYTWTPSPEEIAMLQPAASGAGAKLPAPGGKAFHDTTNDLKPGTASPKVSEGLEQQQQQQQQEQALPAASPSTGPVSPVLGFTTPRMSNAFARRHGLNPKDNAMINLQKIVIQSQVVPQPLLPAQLNAGGNFARASNGRNNSGNRKAYGQPMPPPPPAISMQHPLLMQPQYPFHGQALGAMQQAHDPAALAMLHQQLAALSLQQHPGLQDSSQ